MYNKSYQLTLSHLDRIAALICGCGSVVGYPHWPVSHAPPTDSFNSDVGLLAPTKVLDECSLRVLGALVRAISNFLTVFFFNPLSAACREFRVCNVDGLPKPKSHDPWTFQGRGEPIKLQTPVFITGAEEGKEGKNGRQKGYAIVPLSSTS